MNNTDKEYFRLLDLILSQGRVKKNRTGIDTIGVFGAQARFNLQEGFPILTTKKVWFKGVVHELLWFISGSTNIKYLVDNDVHIWDEWAYKRYTDVNVAYIPENELEPVCPPSGFSLSDVIHLSIGEFIDRIKNDSIFSKKWGQLGEGTYGSMWRNFPCIDPNKIDYDYVPQDNVDQLQKVIDKLKTNPDDRRMIVSSWHPYWVDHCALPPCHVLFQFHTEELTDWERSYISDERGNNIGMTSVHEMNEREFDKLNIPKRRLNLQLYQRSCDTFLGVPFNVSSYSLLLAMVAHVVGMVPGEFIHTYGDLHIYSNHVEQCKLQLSRSPKDLPKLWLNPEVKSLFDFKYKDIKLEGYDPHPAIKGEVAV